MADRVSASIRLGGALPRAHLDELLDAIAAERLSTEWDGSPFEPDEIPADAPLELMQTEVAGGSFDQLEAFCVEHQLHFVRSCDAYPGGWDAERLVFDGSGDPRSYRVTQDDRVAVTFAELRALETIEAIATYFASAEIAVPPLTLVDEEQVDG